ncbi:hypothetical protein [Rathayibacter rathayi]|uniref:hypothetical protein n=1 Tax=Rathayibacter rathayi TaxID=33887 RepID=UPI001F264FA7|nr:hypothetical protein [Rathayibacter rathayi]
MRFALDAVEPGFGDDLALLVKREGGQVAHSDPLAVRVFGLLADLARGEFSGLLLEERDGTADLSDCRKVYFDRDPREPRPRFRLVYRLLPSDIRPTTVHAVAVGYRAGLDAYVRAARNLGRL